MAINAIPSTLLFVISALVVMLLFQKLVARHLQNGTFYETLKRYYGKDYRYEDILPMDVYAGMKK